MKSNTRSLLQELDALYDSHDSVFLIENRANNIIASAINLVETLYARYPAEKAEYLERKLLIAIKNKDPKKFISALRGKK